MNFQKSSWKSWQSGTNTKAIIPPLMYVVLRFVFLDDDLAEAIKYLSEKDREILLMYFFLGMSDTEIGDRLKINRSTSFRSRKNSLEEIKKKLKENMNDE